MSDYDNDEFEQEEGQVEDATTHLIRLIIELKAVKDLTKSANI